MASALKPSASSTWPSRRPTGWGSRTARPRAARGTPRPSRLARSVAWCQRPRHTTRCRSSEPGAAPRDLDGSRSSSATAPAARDRHGLRGGRAYGPAVTWDLTPVAAADVLERLGEVVEREVVGQHAFASTRPRPSRSSRGAERVEHGHRAEHGDLVVVDPERGQRQPASPWATPKTSAARRASASKAASIAAGRPWRRPRRRSTESSVRHRPPRSRRAARPAPSVPLRCGSTTATRSRPRAGSAVEQQPHRARAEHQRRPRRADQPVHAAHRAGQRLDRARPSRKSASGSA